MSEILELTPFSRIYSYPIMSADYINKLLMAGAWIRFAYCFLLLGNLAACGSPDDEKFLRNLKKDQLLIMCVLLHERDSLPMQEYGVELIADLIRLWESDPRQFPESLQTRHYPKRDIEFTLIKATKLFAGHEEAKAGKAFIYRMVDFSDESGQDRAMHAIVELDGEGATDTLLAKLRYPVDSARITAASLLGDYGRVECVAELQRILDERTHGMSKSIEKDYSLEWIQTAIEKLKDRAKGDGGPSVSERMSAKDLIERGPPVITPPDSFQVDKSPAVPEQIANERVETEAVTASSVATAATTTPSIAFYWTGAGVAIALLVGLLVFWKRRV